jgi:hypothetical protein
MTFSIYVTFKKFTVPMIACCNEVLGIGSTDSVVVTLFLDYVCYLRLVNTLILELCHIYCNACGKLQRAVLSGNNSGKIH